MFRSACITYRHRSESHAWMTHSLFLCESTMYKQIMNRVNTQCIYILTRCSTCNVNITMIAIDQLCMTFDRMKVYFRIKFDRNKRCWRYFDGRLYMNETQRNATQRTKKWRILRSRFTVRGHHRCSVLHRWIGKSNINKNTSSTSQSFVFTQLSNTTMTTFWHILFASSTTMNLSTFSIGFVE
jgi:hypothetical protein